MVDLSLLEDFVVGASESLQEMETALLALESAPNNNELLNTVFRAIHTIKGAAQFVGLEKTSALSHALEDLLDLLREEKKTATLNIIALLIETKDRINLLIYDLERLQTEETEVDDLIVRINSHLKVDIAEETELDISSFLSAQEQDAELSNFLSEEEVNENMSAFLSEKSEDNRADFLSNAYKTKPEPDSCALEIEEFTIPDETYDQELFEIFILQLQEKFSVLISCCAKLETSESKNKLLAVVVETLDRLKHSAHYMSYDPLVFIYEHWKNKALAAQKDLTRTTDVSFAFMKDYLAKLHTIFPQLNAIETKVDTLNVLNTKNAAVDELALIDDNEHLFNRLSSAVDASILEQSLSSDSINEVFGTLFDSKGEKEQLKPDKEKSLTPQVKTLPEVDKEQAKLFISPYYTEEKLTNASLQQNFDKKANNFVTATTPEPVFKKSIRIDADKIDALMNQVGELIVDRAYLFQLATEISELQQYLKTTGLDQKNLKSIRTFAYRFSEAIISLGRTSNELQEGVMKIRMLPMRQVFNRFPRLVHDVAKSNHKKVQLEIRGEETELDKMIIEEISDPLMHMIRNAIDHGIESPEERVKMGKLETGLLILEAYHESNHIVIEITDDGRGIDIDRIKDKARQMKLFTQAELDKMTKMDLTRFIMMPGISTAKQVSNTSGRGVGMDVVKKNIEKLNGTIDVESKPGIETKIRLKIPLTLAIIPALLVKVGMHSFTIPLANVEETLQVQHSEISMMEKTEVMSLRGKTVPIFRLATLFSLQPESKAINNDFFVVIVNTGTQTIGLMVDALIGQEEVVIKSLVDYLHEHNCFSGATIIGDGRISLILDIYELVKMTTNQQIKKHHQQEKNHWHH